MMAQAAEAFDRNLAQVHSAIDLAAAWTRQGLSPVVISGIGGKPGQFETMQDQLVDRLNQLGQYAEAQGVVVALEHHIGAAIETPDQAVALMQQVESPAIRINFDISHFNVAGFSLEESISKVLPYAAHTHIKDERGRAPDHEYLIPGEGEFDYVAYLKMMQAHGYEGVISTEISMMVQTRPDYDPLATAAQSYQVLSRAFAEAGIER
jgi:inosose dehydratase